MSEHKWTIKRLIQYAQTMDRGRKSQSSQGRMGKRRLAFYARKWAREKTNRGGQ